MAYIDLAARFGPANLDQAFPRASVAQDTVDFSAREWSVIDLARQDRLSSLREESDFMAFARMLFGVRRQRPLADPHLEALRRMAVMSWHYGYNVHADELEAFLGAGYSIDHYEAMLGHIGHERAAAGRRTRR